MASSLRKATMPSGDPLTLELRRRLRRAALDWDLEALRELEAAPPSGRRWRPTDLAPGRTPIGGRPRPASDLRLLRGRRLLAVAALRPGEEGATTPTPSEGSWSPEGEAGRLHEALLSREYGPDGKARRLGLELYEESTRPRSAWLRIGSQARKARAAADQVEAQDGRHPRRWPTRADPAAP